MTGFKAMQFGQEPFCEGWPQRMAEAVFGHEFHLPWDIRGALSDEEMKVYRAMIRGSVEEAIPIYTKFMLTRQRSGMSVNDPDAEIICRSMSDFIKTMVTSLFKRFAPA